MEQYSTHNAIASTPPTGISLAAIILTRTSSAAIRDMTIACATSLIENANADNFSISVIVIESSPHPLADYPDWIETIHVEGEFNFNRSLNIGISSAGSRDWYLLCNNDLVFEKDWLKRIELAILRYPQILSASPISPTCREQRCFIDSNNTHKVVFGYNRRRELSGWCLMVSNEALGTIGSFDERFKFYFSDDDYALSLRRHNILHALVTDSIVFHLEDIKISKTHPPPHSIFSHQVKIPRYLRQQRHRWITENAAMYDGFKAYEEKWGDYRIIYLKKRIHNLLFLRFGIKALSRLLFSPTS